MIPANISGYGVVGPTGNRLSSAAPTDLAAPRQPTAPSGGSESPPARNSDDVRVQLSTQGRTMPSAGNTPAATQAEQTQTRLAVQRAQAMYSANAVMAQREFDRVTAS